MTAASSQQVRLEFEKLKALFDSNHFSKIDATSILKLSIYFPIGALLLTVRIFLLIILFVILNTNGESLRKNRFFIRLTCAIFGIHTPSVLGEIELDSDNLVIFASNHVTCLDYLSIKSVVSSSNYFRAAEPNEISIKQTNFIANFSKNFFVRQFQARVEKENLNDLYKLKQNYPIITFPEGVCTNGRRALLKFDPKPFDIELEGLTVKPVCLSVHRPFLPLSINYLYSSDFLNMLIIMFSPITIFNLRFLPKQTKQSNESSVDFAERVRALVANEARIESSEYSYENLNGICNKYLRLLKEEASARQTQQTSQTSQNTQLKQNKSSMSFDDISRIALQVKDILPDASFETIQRHIHLSSTLDIDTVIASILDSASEDSAADSNLLTPNTPQSSGTNQTIYARGNSYPSMLVNTNNSAQSSGSSTQRHQNQVLQTSKSVGAKLTSHKSYEEKKFELLNEARKRYLAKQNL
jgi:1-acyl-sn-glycerol-3-phosphate acyltransferase